MTAAAIDRHTWAQLLAAEPQFVPDLLKSRARQGDCASLVEAVQGGALPFLPEGESPLIDVLLELAHYRDDVVHEQSRQLAQLWIARAPTVLAHQVTSILQRGRVHLSPDFGARPWAAMIAAGKALRARLGMEQGESAVDWVRMLFQTVSEREETQAYAAAATQVLYDLPFTLLPRCNAQESAVARLIDVVPERTLPLVLAFIRDHSAPACEPDWQAELARACQQQVHTDSWSSDDRAHANGCAMAAVHLLDLGVTPTTETQALLRRLGSSFLVRLIERGAFDVYGATGDPPVNPDSLALAKRILPRLAAWGVPLDDNDLASGRTPLQTALAKSSWQVAEALLEHGCALERTGSKDPDPPLAKLHTILAAGSVSYRDAAQALYDRMLALAARQAVDDALTLATPSP